MLKQISLRLYLLAIAMCCTVFLATSCSDDEEGIRVTNVSLNESELSIVAGQKQILTATITPEDATNKEVIWKSSDESVATVNETGEVTAISKGDVVITVTTVDGNKTARCLFIVEKATIPVTSVSLNKTELSLFTDKKETLIATITPDEATVKTVTWESSNEAVATVSETGEVTAISVGIATITVTSTDGNKTATCNVTVEAPKQYTIKFNTNGGSKLDDIVLNEGERLIQPENPTMAGGNTAEGLYLGIVDPEISATFDGWFTDEQLTTAYNFNMPVTSDLTLYARWDGTGPDPIDVSAVAGSNIVEKAFAYLKNQTLQALTAYTLVVASDITANKLTDFANANVTLTIVGKEKERVIQKTNVGNFFEIKAGTLTLGNNIKITGTGLGKYRPFYLTASGNLIMKKGSKISDLTQGMTGNTAAIHMDSGTTSFTMEGGEICNNAVQATESDFAFMGAAICAFRGKVNIKDGLISNNKIITNRASYETSGGIYVTNGWNTEFNKTGGIIKDNTAENNGTGTGKIGQQVLWKNEKDNIFKKIDANLGATDNPTTSNMSDPLWKAVN